MIPPPPRSTLFPYTTLFRSGQLQASAARLIPFDQLEDPLTRLLEDFGPPRKSPHPELPFYHLQSDGDRKSTRLNSSHVEISYAVFCLKKKNNQKKQLIITIH